MADSEWIDVLDRMPEARDADSTGRVMVWHVLNGVMMTGWHRIEENRFISHWRKPPKAPEGMKEPERKDAGWRDPITMI